MLNRVSGSNHLGGDLAIAMQVNDKHKNNRSDSLCAMNVIDQQHGRTVFFSEEFERIMTKYSNFTLEYRVNNAVVNHAEKNLNICTFHLYWTDSQEHLHPLKVTFSLGEPFSSGYSRFLTEKNLIGLVSGYRLAGLNPGQLYYSLKVEQIVNNEPRKYVHLSNKNLKQFDGNFSEIQLLSMWFTLDGLIGELRHIAPGENLSGNEVLRIYEYFAKFFKIDNIFICDDSMLEDEQRSARIPLRVISAIATSQTWFENHLPGVQLFESHHLPIADHDVIQQSRKARSTSLQELQTLPLGKWADMLDAMQKKKLFLLYQKYFPKKQSSVRFFKNRNDDSQEAVSFGDESVKALTEAVYKDSKSQRVLTADLGQLNDLLCGNIVLEFGKIPLNKKSPDYWVKSRVHQLMWGSYIWKQKAGSKPTDHFEPSLLH